MGVRSQSHRAIATTLRDASRAHSCPLAERALVWTARVYIVADSRHQAEGSARFARMQLYIWGWLESPGAYFHSVLPCFSCLIYASELCRQLRVSIFLLSRPVRDGKQLPKVYWTRALARGGCDPRLQKPHHQYHHLHSSCVLNRFASDFHSRPPFRPFVPEPFVLGS